MTLRNAFDALATETTLSDINSKITNTPSGALSVGGVLVDMPVQDTPSLPVRQSPQKYVDISFSQVGSGLLSPEMTLIRTGSGQTVNQSNGNLVITTGTTANAETVIRSNTPFNGAFTLRQVTTLSQRIVNNNFFVEMVDVLGDGLAYTIVNTTTVDVTLTAHGFTAQNVGQRIDLCALSSVGVPMEGVIASIPNADTIRFTVAGWPASGSGTLSLTGWNKVEALYNGAGATALLFNTRRRGWQNTAVSVLIGSTASGHMLHINAESGVISLGDKVLNAGTVITNRSTWEQNIPLPEEVLYVQLRARNGTTAPASTTTWTLGMVRVEDYVPSQVSLTSTRQQSLASNLPVSVISTVSTAVTGTVTANVNLPTGTGFSINSAATINANVIKATAGALHVLVASNHGTSDCFLKLYQKTTAPVAGDVPVQTHRITPGSTLLLDFGPSGMRFNTGIGMMVTRLAPDSDNTPIGAGEVKVQASFI